ncbi:MAG: hypothetical protein J6R47_04590 [Acholeplasmatales bacterium]|nr:hypothetical protein [Acholeplasmatales bacterium]
MQTSLVSYQTKVESPFVKLQIGDYTFGHCQRNVDRIKLSSLLKITYPNYIVSLNVKKINGAINTYTIRMQYAITENDDPNMLERVFSSISNTRIITISYGDWMLPNYIYKNEECILTKITSNVDFNNSKIDYTLTAVSNSLNLTSGNHSFPGGKYKPSDLIKKILKDETYGLLDIFYGMRNLSEDKLNQLIVGNDATIELKAQNNVSILTYINYLVSCMCTKEDVTSNDLKTSRYYWATYDDISNEYSGPYFKVINVPANAKYNLAYNCYEVDIGYPTGNFISSFTIDNNESWSILYNHSNQVSTSEYVYDIDNDGNMSMKYSPLITTSAKYGETTAASRAWWSNMTQYPISAKITLKGLLKPALLMSYVKVNAYFYGKKHISSGLYIITKQEDQIDSNGYKTTLSITRISGDETYDL